MKPQSNEDNLLLRLHKWASRQDENFLTEAFAHLLCHLRDHEPKVAVRILARLTGNYLEIPLEGVIELDIATQITTERGRPDLELRTLDHLVYVEVKLESQPRKKQITRYREQLRESGVSNTTLVLLTRYPPDLSGEDELPDVSRRWYEVAEWLERELENHGISDPTSVFLTEQCVGFLKRRNIAMNRVGWELPAGIRSIRNLLMMLGEAIASRKLQLAKSGAWDWIGYYFDNQKFFLGVYFDHPEVVMFETFRVTISRDAAERLAVGRLEEIRSLPGGIRWVQELELESEEVHFFARSREQQMQRLEKFLDDSLKLAAQIIESKRE